MWFSNHLISLFKVWREQKKRACFKLGQGNLLSAETQLNIVYPTWSILPPFLLPLPYFEKASDRIISNLMVFYPSGPSIPTIPKVALSVIQNFCQFSEHFHKIVYLEWKRRKEHKQFSVWMVMCYTAEAKNSDFWSALPAPKSLSYVPIPPQKWINKN